MNPTVCAVMLVNGRAEMVKRAIASFRAQTYEAKVLLVLDSGDPWLRENDEIDETGIEYVPWVLRPNTTIGALRNKANQIVFDNHYADLIAHFDSDDWSHPRRLEEQVALLQASGKACVGYRELLFWDTRVAQIEVDPSRVGPDGVGCLGTVKSVGEAWLYRGQDPRWCAGASMLYRREAWEACPFDNAPHEDQRWWLKNAEKCLGVSSCPEMRNLAVHHEPRMICRMHLGGTEQIPRDVMLRGDVWHRVSQFDQYCAEKMAL